jgi:predicted DNA binding protein
VTVVASVLVDADAFAIGRAFSDTDCRLELARYVPVDADGGSVPYVWVDRLADREAFEATVESSPAVERIERFDGGIDRRLYRIEWAATVAEDGLLAALRESDLLVKRAIRTSAERWLLRLRAHDHRALTAFRHACVDAGVAIDVRRIAHGPNSGDPYGLTDKQRAALVLAFDEGYFDVPHGTTLTELADLAGVSRQAYTRRLDRALRNYLTNTGIDELQR